MELHEYPRPANDTGIGVHWSAGYASAVGISKIREFWIPEMKAMGVKWVKIFNHDGALDFAELLLAEGLMPIVRIYRPSPNPGRLGVKEIVQIDSFLRIGVSPAPQGGAAIVARLRVYTNRALSDAQLQSLTS